MQIKLSFPRGITRPNVHLHPYPYIPLFMPDIPTSDSSASTSPLLLTPESTGSQLAIVIESPSSNAGSVSPSTTKKARRQTAFYPNMNSSNKPQKPFSRSAAKRESVMALGSIEHLQHYFTKTGLASKKA